MPEGIIRLKDLGLIGRWRMRRAARTCGNQILQRLSQTYGRRQQYSLQQIRELKRDASLNDYETAITAGFFLNEKELEAAAKRFTFVLFDLDARNLVKREVKNLTVLETTTHAADGGRDTWDNKLGRE